MGLAVTGRFWENAGGGSGRFWAGVRGKAEDAALSEIPTS